MEDQAEPLVTLLPIIIVSISVAFVSYVTAKRKGRNPVLFAVIALVPFIGGLVLLFLIGITDKEVYDRLGRIEERVTAN